MEVRSRLQRAELPPDEIDDAVRELVELGYVDDARYARIFTQDRRALDGWGSERIERVLRQRGVAQDLITAALQDRLGGLVHDIGQAGRQAAPDELGRAIALLTGRFPTGPGSDRDRNRAFGVLARKGYGSEIAADAVRAWSRVSTR
jgi:regulatory protein